MEALKAAIVDVSTGETSFRDLTAKELTDYQNAVNAQNEAEAKKALLLEKLGLTVDEFDLLVSNVVKVENAKLADEA